MESHNFCENCGTKLPQRAHFCPSCGTPIAQDGEFREPHDLPSHRIAHARDDTSEPCSSEHESHVPEKVSSSDTHRAQPGNLITRLLSSRILFVVIYILLVTPTYVLPFFGSNSAVLGTIAELGSASSGAGNVVAPLFLLHIIALFMVFVLVWFRGVCTGQPWIAIFPFFAGLFDLAPFLNWIFLAPTVFHVIGVVMGVKGDAEKAGGRISATQATLAGIVLLALIGMFVNSRSKITQGLTEENTHRRTTYAHSRTFQSINATVTAMRFFEGGTDAPPIEQRYYETKFTKSDVRFIYWELNLYHPPPGKRFDFTINAVYYRPDNTVFDRSSLNSYIDADWTYSYHQQGRGWADPGHWSPGVYRVDITIEGRVVATGSFEILPFKSVEVPLLESESVSTDQRNIGREAVPKHNIGDTYTFESINLVNGSLIGSTERKVTLANFERLVIESRNILSKTTATRRLEFTPEWNLVAIHNSDGSELTYSPPLKYYEFPLFPGRTWRQTSIETNTRTGGVREHRLSAIVGDWEEVTVPAGKFRGLRVTIESELVDRATGQRSTGTDISWYVPEVRRSVKSLTSSRSPEGFESRQEIRLIKYDVMR